MLLKNSYLFYADRHKSPKLSFAPEPLGLPSKTMLKNSHLVMWFVFNACILKYIYVNLFVCGN